MKRTLLLLPPTAVKEAVERRRNRSDGLCRWAKLQVRGWTVLMPGWDVTDENIELEMIRDDDPTFKPRRPTLLSFGEMRGTRAARSSNNADELLEYVCYHADASSTPPIDRTVLGVRSGVGPTEARITDGSDAGIGSDR